MYSSPLRGLRGLYIKSIRHRLAQPQVAVGVWRTDRTDFARRSGVTAAIVSSMERPVASVELINLVISFRATQIKCSEEIVVEADLR